MQSLIAITIKKLLSVKVDPITAVLKYSVPSVKPVVKAKCILIT